MIIYRVATRNDGRYWVRSFPVIRSNKQIVQLINYDNDKYGWFRANIIDEHVDLNPSDFPEIDITSRRSIQAKHPHSDDANMIGYEFMESDLL